MLFRSKVILIGMLVSTPAAFSADKKDSLKKDLSFDEILIKGKHHFNDEAVITVEEDKVLNGLLEVKKDFKDRMKKSKVRY